MFEVILWRTVITSFCLKALLVADLWVAWEYSGVSVLVNGGNTFQGHKGIIAHLQELDGFMDLWYKFQSDACYCDESGQIE
jgi:hypothetical protein